MAEDNAITGMRARNLATPGTGLETKLWTRSFTLLCITVMLGYAHHALMTPTVPLYVDDKGGSALLAGLALLAFSVPSVAVRPFLGKLSDAWNPVWILTIGLVLLALGGLLFITPLLAMVFFAGIVRGVGWAGLNTGGYTALATAAPALRRGEASGYYTGITASASVFFPALALWLIDGPGSFQLVFLLSAVIAASGLPFAFSMARMMREPQAVSQPSRVQPSGGLFERGVLLATGLNFCSTLAAPAVTAFLPLYARSLDIGNIGLYYVFAGLTSIVIRPLLGQKSDAIGRGPSIAFGLISQLAGLLMIVAATSLPLILLGGVFMSLGSAMNSSATTALAMDLAAPESRGKSMATFSISFQLGAGVGAILAGALADAVGFRGMYVGAIAITVLGLGLLAATWKSLPRPATPGEPELA
ncbi:MAG: MFS transporter [Dehalococcoidia bacterium]|nr:MFS transporter [Dehalococcoidia bacterium]